MQLEQTVQQVFGQLAGSLCQLPGGAYAQPCRTLSGSTIGAHVRHIIELFQALDKGYVTGLVNYDRRKRDKALEQDPDLACSALDIISEGIDKPDKALLLETEYQACEGPEICLPTWYLREVAYNLEHTIHHMALIRIGIVELEPGMALPDSYGVASSTVKHRSQCAR